MNNYSFKRILAVGATGFLGSVLVEELSRAGFRVICGVRNMGKVKKSLVFPVLGFSK